MNVGFHPEFFTWTILHAHCFCYPFTELQSLGLPDNTESTHLSLVMKYSHWLDVQLALAAWLAEAPLRVLEIEEEGAQLVVPRQHPNCSMVYDNIRTIR